MKNSFRTTGTCARTINFEIEDNKVKNVEFVGGCAGFIQLKPAAIQQDWGWLSPSCWSRKWAEK